MEGFDGIGGPEPASSSEPAASMTKAELHEQVALQCRAVAHMAKALADVHADKARIIAGGNYSPVELVGQQTAYFMETLGNILNGMDAVDDDEDEWMEPVFRKAQELWPDAGHH